MVPKLLRIASTPANVINWGGTETTSIEEWCTYMGELTGLEPKFRPTAETIESVIPDTSRMVSLIGGTEISWREGLRRMIAHRMPELLKN
jgi:UDP-glucuronate 4-epimerase